MRNFANGVIAIFAEQMLFFCCTNEMFCVCSTNFFKCAVQTFAASLPPFGVRFCRLLAQVLLPYGTSFAPLWRKICHLMLHILLPYIKFLKRSTKVSCISLGVSV